VNLTISPQIRILALVGVLAALGLGASMFVFGGHSSKTETLSVTTPTHRQQTPPAKPAKPAKPATTPAKPATKPHAAAKPATKAHHRRVAAKAKPQAFRGNAVYAQLPQPLQWQLAHHKVVVVSLYNPRANVDAISVAEAHAGAVAAGAGFLLVDVLDNKVAGLLTALLPGGGLLPDPGVLVYRAPGDVAIRLDGFNDRDAVAQAATNALAGENDGSATDPAVTLPVATTPAVAAPAPTTTPAP
jgi:hypothetical protein